jgi:hypothetical protein
METASIIENFVTFYPTSRRYMPTDNNIRISFHIFSPHCIILTLQDATAQVNVSNIRKNSKLALGEYRSSGPHRILRDEVDFEPPCYGLCRHDQ